MNPEPGTTLLTITDVAYRGKGLSRLDGQVVFVPGVLPGEKVRVRLTRSHRNYVDAELVEVIEPSPSRVPPACPLSGRCPGCCYQHVAYAEEARLKQAQFAMFLNRHAAERTTLQFADPVSSPAELGYRNKIVLHSSGSGERSPLGYVAEDNETVIDVPQCPLAIAPLNELLNDLRASKEFRRSLKPHGSIVLRHTRRNGPSFCVGKADPDKPLLVESTVIGDIQVPFGSFFQVNPEVSDRLVSHVMDILEKLKPPGVVDVYCGVGMFALAAAQVGVQKVVGIDYDPMGISAARKNAEERGLSGVEFLARPASKVLRIVFDRMQPDRTTVIVDPPRRGLDKEVSALIAERRPRNVIYVSCAVDTLARDLMTLCAAGYRIDNAALFDMFPRTPYFESVTHLRMD